MEAPTLQCDEGLLPVTNGGALDPEHLPPIGLAAIAHVSFSIWRTASWTLVHGLSQVEEYLIQLLL
ncbi:hypothetical protein M1O17_05080, partial [Dehalococcoidia bacterium]|nr:hypothetical protein [Dehalococcoidia bacterium]